MPGEIRVWPLEVCWPWDQHREPECARKDGTPYLDAPPWCSMPWCYVDEDCEETHSTAVFFPSGVGGQTIALSLLLPILFCATSDKFLKSIYISFLSQRSDRFSFRNKRTFFIDEFPRAVFCSLSKNLAQGRTRRRSDSSLMRHATLIMSLNSMVFLACNSACGTAYRKNPTSPSC